MRRYRRDEVVRRLKGTLDRGESIVTAGSGIGLSAKFAEKGGADLVVVYNSGRYRMQGLASWGGLMPIGDANGTMLEMGEREILPIVDEIPVIGGVFASDPTRVLEVLLDRVKSVGFAGVTNFPTVGLLEGDFRASLEQTGLGFQREVDMVRYARSIDLYTIVYVFDAEQSRQMAEAGVDCVVAHMGNTVGGSVGQEDGVKPMDLAVERTRAIAEACWSVNPEIPVLCHGGPIALPEDAARVIAEAGVQGFVAASSIERLPVEGALLQATRAFKAIKTAGARP